MQIKLPFSFVNPRFYFGVLYLADSILSLTLKKSAENRSIESLPYYLHKYIPDEALYNSDQAYSLLLPESYCSYSAKFFHILFEKKLVLFLAVLMAVYR